MRRRRTRRNPDVIGGVVKLAVLGGVGIALFGLINSTKVGPSSVKVPGLPTIGLPDTGNPSDPAIADPGTFGDITRIMNANPSFCDEMAHYKDRSVNLLSGLDPTLWNTNADNWPQFRKWLYDRGSPDPGSKAPEAFYSQNGCVRTPIGNLIKVNPGSTQLFGNLLKG